MGLDESKMNRFSCVMQPGLNYKEMRHIYLWSTCVSFLGVLMAWHPSPKQTQPHGRSPSLRQRLAVGVYESDLPPEDSSVQDAMLSSGGREKLLQLMNNFQKLKMVLLAMLLPQGGCSLTLPSVPKSA